MIMFFIRLVLFFIFWAPIIIIIIIIIIFISERIFNTRIIKVVKVTNLSFL